MDPKECAKRKRNLCDVDWDTCPVRASVEDEFSDFIEDLYRASKVNPLSNWPSQYTSPVVRLLPAYATELENVKAWIERNA